jgi:hypothetical protein
MNPLVASVIRTLVPVAVGQVASWLLLLNVTLPLSAQEGLGAFLGGLLTAIYYVGVRIIEQQWPVFGVLLGLPKSPDTYSKDAPLIPAVPESPALTALASVVTDPVPATVFPAAKVEAALATPEPVIVEPVYTPPAP